jgi:ATP-dependent helicase YprA (DUF1998 family)
VLHRKARSGNGGTSLAEAAQAHEEAPGTWNPEKLAVYLARRLNHDPKSALHTRIRVGVVDTITEQKDASLPMVSLATVVQGILQLISKKPADDRNLMASAEGRTRSRRRLADRRDSAPLRSLFLDERDAVIYAVVRNFFEAASHCLFEKANPKLIHSENSWVPGPV